MPSNPESVPRAMQSYFDAIVGGRHPSPCRLTGIVMG